MILDEYKKKRDFSQTPEPQDPIDTDQKSIFVIQEHDSRRLHWDLRLQFGDVLKSWAVPKEPPVEAGIRRLAVPTEDHPLEYADFEGEIPEGQYGAGTVTVWDRGVFEPIEVDDEKGRIIFRVDSKRLSGVYCLIKTAPRAGKEQWLFFRKKDSK